MSQSDVTSFAQQSKAKADRLDQTPLGYFILSVLAGAYLGLAITLIFSVGAPFAAAGSPAFKLVMGAAFGVALALVIFAGSELFTGNNMVCAVGALTRAISWGTLARIFGVSLIGNLAGSLWVAWLVAQSGVLSQAPQVDLVLKVATSKMTLSGWELMVRGILCNWLVCLAVWTAGRTTNDVAKLVLIFWCLLAFVGSGFEHSIANQSLLGIALFLPHPDSVSWLGLLRNQIFVIAGNIIGGGVFVGGFYWLASLSPAPSSSTVEVRVSPPVPGHSTAL